MGWSRTLSLDVSTMTIRCLLGFHSWKHSFYLVGEEGKVSSKEFRICKHCNATDMFCCNKFKFIRTDCINTDHNTINKWFIKYEDREVEEGDNWDE